MNTKLTLIAGGLVSAILVTACSHNIPAEEISKAEAETPTVYYSMTEIYQPNFQGVADTAFYAYNDDGELDASLLTDEQWSLMKESAEMLRDTSLAFANEDNIRVAEPGEELFNEGQGFIPSEAVQSVIDENPDGFRAMMMYLSEEADRTLEAIEARDAQALSDSSDALYSACKSCHVAYWYPGRK